MKVYYPEEIIGLVEHLTLEHRLTPMIPTNQSELMHAAFVAAYNDGVADMAIAVRDYFNDLEKMKNEQAEYEMP